MDTLHNAPARPSLEKPPLNMKREIFEWTCCVVIVLVVTLIIRTFFFTMIHVDGNSMTETLLNGDRLAVTLLDMRINGPQRGDVVICTYPDADHLCVKRVIGLPGETLEIRDGITYIDGEPLEEGYIVHTPWQDYGPITVEADHYFVMGDNRPVSKDSRSVGTLERSAIHGKAQMILWPFDRFGPIDTTQSNDINPIE